MQDLEEWKNQDTQQEVVVTQIPLTGDLVSDPRKFLDGQFYYLKVEKWVYQKEEDEDSSGWEKEDGGSYTVRGDHVAAALDDQTELTEDNVRGLEWFDEFYPGGKNGDTRYQIWGLGEDAQLTAVAIERCRKTAVLGAENRGYSVGNRRICGDLDAFGQYIMDCGRNGASDFWSRGMDGFVCVGRESGGAGRERLNGGFIQYMKEAGSRLRPQSA